MISRREFDQGIQVVLSSFNRKVPEATVATWYTALGPRFDRTSWANACRATVTEEEIFPSNLVRAMLSRAPKKPSPETVIPINPDTGKPFTPEEAHLNRQRLGMLMHLMWDQDNPRRGRILDLAQDPDAGQAIINELDESLARAGHLEEAPF